MLHSNYWIVGRWLELHTLTSVDLAVQIKRATLSKDCNTRTGLHFKNVSTFPSKRLWLQPLTWTLCRNKMKFLIKDLIIALEISLLSSIPRGEETLNFKVSNFLPKKNRKGHFCLEMNVQLLEEKSARHFLHNFPQSILLWANRRRRLGYLQVICGHIFFLGNTYLKIWKVHGLKYSFPFPHFLFNGKLRLVIFVAHWNLTSLISRSIGRDCSSFWKRIKKELRLINMYLLSCIQNTYRHSFLWTILRFDEEKDALFIYFCIPTWIDLGNKSFWLQ